MGSEGGHRRNRAEDVLFLLLLFWLTLTEYLV